MTNSASCSYEDLLNVYPVQTCDFLRDVEITEISITQNLFHQGKFITDISLNDLYIVALKIVRDRKQVMYLANQVYPEDSIGLYNAYLDVTQGTHGYLILNQIQDTNDGLRFRTNVFLTDKYPLTFYSGIRDEAREIELSNPPRALDGRT